MGHTATLLSSGQVLIAGGGNCNSGCLDFKTAELYDPNSGSFSPTPGNLATPYVGGAAILLTSNKVLIAGGTSDGSTLNSLAELYDPATGSFTQSGAMVNPRSSFTATLLQNGNVLIAGGEAGIDGFAGRRNLQFLCRNICLDWEPEFSTTVSHRQFAFERQSPDRWRKLHPPNTAELYDPAGGTFSLTGNLGETRWSPMATALSERRRLNCRR